MIGAVALVVVAAGLSLEASHGPQASAAAAIEPDRAVEWVSGGVPIQGSYRAPAAGVTGAPAALIIGGTGDVDRDGNSALLPGVAMDEYRWLADRLSAQGIASVRYDKIGTGATGLGPYTSDPSAMLGLSYDQLRVQPARDGLAFLAAQPGIDASRLLVIGHSEGGGVALALNAAPKNAPAPARLALIEPLYARILDVLHRQFSDQIQEAVQAGAMPASDATTLIDWMQAGIVEIRTGTPPYPAPGPVPLPGATGFTAVMQATIASNIYGSDPAQMVLSHSYRTGYGKEFDAIDGSTFARSANVPTLVTCGTKDFNTPCALGGGPGSGVAALAASFPPGIAHFVVLPDTVHILRDVGAADPRSLAEQSTYPFSAVLATAFDAFVAALVPPPPPPTTTTTSTAPPRAQPVVATPSFTG